MGVAVVWVLLRFIKRFKPRLRRQQLTRVEVRQSGCLNHCSSGAVALVYQTDWGDFPWLPTKVRLKIRRRFFPDPLPLRSFDECRYSRDRRVALC